MAATFRRRLQRGAASTAVAALVLAALTASQAPGATGDAAAKRQPAPPPADVPIDGGSGYYTDLPPLNSPVPPQGSDHNGQGPATGRGPAEAGLPATVLAAYKKAASTLGTDDPGCRLPWQLLAGIGKVESGQARGGAVDAEGTTLRPILGPQLNGRGFARITDTDNGRYDGDLTHDRAVGPMQFIPSTWSTGGPDGAGWGADGNGDGKKDPHNVFDAALAAGGYLCAGGRDLTAQDDLDRAILGYNHSEEYLRTVLSWYAFYRNGTHEVPDGKGVLPVHRDAGRHDDNGGRSEGRRPHGHGGKPDKSPRPGGSGKPGKGHKPGKGQQHDPGKPGRPDGTGPTPGGTEPPSQKPTPTPEPPTGPAHPTALVRVGDKDLSTTAGAEFATPPQVRAQDAEGKAVAGTPVRFTLPAATDARFPGDATAVTVKTDKNGLATAPTLRAGDRTGAFRIRVTTVAHTAPAVELGATVKARPAPKADKLARTSDKELTATAGKAFAEDAVEIKATYQDKIAAGVAVTATMVTDDPKQPVENDKGPYFKDPEATGAAKHKPVRTLTGLTTDADGLLKLPKIYTDAHPGTFLLRLTTADGAVLTVKLKVAAAAGS
ncbi:lytic transglycosylase [Streptomyces nigrescens]|uniref:Lytic transglycosylase n=1 Tax=Streptomyces nigrescens TaxID=1920 RepID=A0ABY7J8M5_STRNI|nr:MULTISPECIES: lytic transglycosylase [Streptomyces]MCX5448982.1 lytic transglycosylase [Streptomyces libani]WAU07590.1 lytic transglycosylase [Streptomyces nigrescens]